MNCDDFSCGAGVMSISRRCVSPVAPPALSRRSLDPEPDSAGSRQSQRESGPFDRPDEASAPQDSARSCRIASTRADSLPVPCPGLAQSLGESPRPPFSSATWQSGAGGLIDLLSLPFVPIIPNHTCWPTRSRSYLQIPQLWHLPFPSSHNVPSSSSIVTPFPLSLEDPKPHRLPPLIPHTSQRPRQPCNHQRQPAHSTRKQVRRHPLRN